MPLCPNFHIIRKKKSQNWNKTHPGCILKQHYHLRSDLFLASPVHGSITLGNTSEKGSKAPWNTAHWWLPASGSLQGGPQVAVLLTVAILWQFCYLRTTEKRNIEALIWEVLFRRIGTPSTLTAAQAHEMPRNNVVSHFQVSPQTNSGAGCIQSLYNQALDWGSGMSSLEKTLKFSSPRGIPLPR